MRPLNAIIAAFAVSLCTALTLPAQTTVSTTPVGFNTATVAAATDSTHPVSTVVSVPFYQIATFQGAISAVPANNQVSFTGTTFTATLTAPPYLARFKTGNSTGRFFVITTVNNDTTITLDTTLAGGSGYTLTTGTPSATQTQVAVGDSVEILPANTLGRLFPGGAPFQTGSSSSSADNIFLWNGSTWDTYFNDGTNWKKTANFNPQNDKVILPDQGLFITRRGITALNLTFLGTVPSTTERTDFRGPGSSFKSNRFPTDTTLGALGLQNLPGWTTGSSSTGIDNVYIWNGSTWEVYFYNGTNWKKTANFNNQDTKAIPLGSAVFVVRQSSAVGSASTLTQNLPYTL